MELLRSITVDSTPTITNLLRFGFVETLKAVKTVLMLYPLNIFILFVVVFVAVHRITSKFGSKKKFRALYDPLPHHDNPVEQIKLIKKEIRDVQGDLIVLLKKRNEGSQQPKEKIIEQVEDSAAVSEQVKTFMEEVNQKSAILEEVENELKQTVSDAFHQISKINEV